MEEVKIPQIGDVVLLYINNFPQAFLHIIDMKIDPNCVSGVGYNVSFMRLEIPMMIFTWQLNEDHLKHGFTMNGVVNTLQVMSRPIVKKDEAPPSVSEEVFINTVRNMAASEDEFI